MSDRDRDRDVEFAQALGGVQEAVETLRRQWEKQDADATQGRRLLYAKVDELRGEQSGVRAELAGLQREMAEIRPAVKQFRDARLRAEGRRGLMAAIWTALITGAGAIGWMIHELLTAFWPPRH